MLIKKILTHTALFTALSVSTFAAIADEVNVYSFRQPFLIEPIMEKFTKQTGIKVNILFAKKGLIERVKREGQLSPADLVLTTDISRLMKLSSQNLTQAVDSKILNENIPNSRLKIFKSSHFFLLEEAPEFISEILSFLKQD